jgi:primase-polymerase (primpol)-like protein
MRAAGRTRPATIPSTWADLSTTIEAALRLKLGIGFMVTPETGLVFGDLDHCIDPKTGQLTVDAADIVAAPILRTSFA